MTDFEEQYGKITEYKYNNDGVWYNFLGNTNIDLNQTTETVYAIQTVKLKAGQLFLYIATEKTPWENKHILTRLHLLKNGAGAVPDWMANPRAPGNKVKCRGLEKLKLQGS